MSTSTKLTPAAASRCSASRTTASTARSSPLHNTAGTPIRSPRSVAGAGISVPVTTESSNATSATVRAIGPAVSRVWLMGSTPAAGYRCRLPPVEGRRPTVPVKAAGTRTEPPVSLPSPAGAIRAAIAAAVPPDDPPGMRDRS